jgi:hypothetical protein
MPWDVRGEKRYYYRTVRPGGRAGRRYVGTGAAAERAAAADGARQRERQRAARALRQEREQLVQAQAPLLQFCEETDLLVRAALVAAGYRQHARSTWRLHRANNDRGQERDQEREHRTAAPGPGGRGPEGPG